ncbi:hypothetical protein Tco_0778899 [Tanacetum coccineum]
MFAWDEDSERLLFPLFTIDSSISVASSSSKSYVVGSTWICNGVASVCYTSGAIMLRFMASDGSDQDARYTLSKLLQRGTVAEYESEFLMLIKRVMEISESLLKSRILQLWEKHFPADLIIEAHFLDKNNQAVDNNVRNQEDPNVNDKQEVKKVDDQEIENVKDEEGNNAQDQQVSKVDDDTNNDDFDSSLPPHIGVDLSAEKVVFKNTTIDLKKDKDEQGKKKKKGVITFFEVGVNKENNPNCMFNDVGGVRYNKADGAWVPARRPEDGWHLFEELGLSKESHYISNLDVHLQFHVDPHDIGSQVKTWDPRIKRIFKTSP